MVFCIFSFQNQPTNPTNKNNKHTVDSHSKVRKITLKYFSNSCDLEHGSRSFKPRWTDVKLNEENHAVSKISHKQHRKPHHSFCQVQTSGNCLPWIHTSHEQHWMHELVHTTTTQSLNTIQTDQNINSKKNTSFMLTFELESNNENNNNKLICRVPLSHQQESSWRFTETYIY